MIRAQFFDDKYFNEYIDDQNKRIEKFVSVQNSSLCNEKKAEISGWIAKLYKDLISAEYSCGYSKKKITGTFNKYIENVVQSKISSYNEYADILALSIIFTVSETTKGIIIEATEYDDDLTNMMKEYLQTGKFHDSNESLNYPQQYEIFRHFLDEKIDTDEFAGYMNSKWYNSCKEFYFYDSHLSKEKVYTGYWSWIAAAVLKMKNVSNIDSIYIPVELL